MKNGLEALLNREVHKLDRINDCINSSPMIDTDWRYNMGEASKVENRIERILTMMEQS